MCRYPWQGTQEPERADWEEFVSQLAKEIMEEQSPKRCVHHGFLLDPPNPIQVAPREDETI